MSSPAESQSDLHGVEKDLQDSKQTTTEEVKPRSKYPSLGRKPGGSDFLMKRLQKGQKYFDSGDYNMAKAKKSKQLPTALPDRSTITGSHIPTPQDLPQRRPSVTSKLGRDRRISFSPCCFTATCHKGAHHDCKKYSHSCRRTLERRGKFVDVKI